MSIYNPPQSGSASPLTTKGDLYGFSSVNARIPIGTDGQVLTADSGQTLGLRWSTPSTGNVTGSGLINRNAYWTSDSNISYDDDNTWDITNKRQGLGTTSPRYRSDVVAPTSTIADMFSFVATLVAESLVGGYTDTLSLIYGPRDDATNNGSAETTYTSGTGYTNFDSVNGTIYSYRIINGVPYLSPLGVSLGTVNVSSNPGAIQWIWTVATNGDGTPVDGYVLLINDVVTATNYSFDVGNVLTYYDSNETGSVSYTPFGTGFISSSQTISYDLFGTGTSPSGGTYYGTSNNFTVSDVYGNSSNFWVQHTISGSGGNAWGENQDSTNGRTGTGDQTYYQTTPYASSLITTQHYGFLANGSNLNISYDSYARNPTLSIFSVDAINSTTTDPNDGLYYAIQFTSNFSVTDAKLIKNGSSGYNYNQNVFYEDTFGPAFIDGNGHDPTVSTVTAQILENKSDTSNQFPQLILNSSAPSDALVYLSFQKGGVEKGYIKNGDSDAFTFSNGANQFIFLSNNSSSPYTYWKDSSGNVKASIGPNGYAGFNTSLTNAVLSLGSADASNTQLLFSSSGVFPSSVQNGAIEFGSSQFYGSDSARRRFIRSAGITVLGSNVIPKADSNGFLVDSGISDNGTTITFGNSEAVLFTTGLSISSNKDIVMGAGARILNGLRTAIASLSASTSLNVANHSPMTEYTGSTAAQTLTLPTAASIGGTYFWLFNRASVSVTEATTSSQNINIGTGTVTSLVLQRGDFVFNVATGSTTWDAFHMQYISTETRGGTNQTSYTQGDLLYASASNTLSKLAKDTNATRYLSNTGTTNNPAWAQVDLSNGVTGTLPVGNGGTASTIRFVDNVALTGQVADITTTAFTHGGTAGTYRVSYSLQDTTADLTAGAVILTVAYTDGAGATTTTATQLLTGTGRQSGSVYIQLASGSVTYATTHTGIFGTAVYALYLSCERLS